MERAYLWHNRILGKRGARPGAELYSDGGADCDGFAFINPIFRDLRDACRGVVPSLRLLRPGSVRGSYADSTSNITSRIARSLAVASPVSSPGPSADQSGQTHTVGEGDTLATIAQQYYEDSGQWRKIYEANKDAIGEDPDSIKIGQSLKIPPK